MEVRAKLSHLRITPRKVRLVADMIRGKQTEQAQVMLRYSKVKAGQVVLKLLNSAIANATNNFKLSDKNLFISTIFVDEGPKLKRFLPVSRGSAHPLWKRNSHVTIILSEINPTAPKAEAKKEAKTEKAKEEIKTETKKEKTKFAREDKKTTKAAGGSINKMFRRKSV